MGIGKDWFCWVKFVFLQPLFRLVPKGPKGQAISTNLKLGKKYKNIVALEETSTNSV